MPKQSGGYEVVPFRMQVPMVPRLVGTAPHLTQNHLTQSLAADGAQSGNATVSPLWVGATSLPTTCAAAEAHGDARRGACRQFARKRQWRELVRVLEEYPKLAMDPVIAIALGQAAKYGWLRHTRGRPVGSYAWHPLWIVGLVKSKVDDGQAASNEEAFHQVASLCKLPASSVKTTYYAALKEKRFQALLLTYDMATVAMDTSTGGLGNAGDRLQKAERLDTGTKITRTIDHALLGPVEVTFEGLPSEPKPRHAPPQSMAQQIQKTIDADAFLYGPLTRDNS